MSVPFEKQSSTVYVVDDDESIREAISNLLESIGIRSEHFASTEEFLRSGRAGAPGCLVLDVRLPGMTGVEFQQELIRRNIRMPIVFMTAHGDIPMVRKVMKSGAIEFLTKPFQKEELLSAIQQAFETSEARREEDAVTQSVRARFATLSSREREVMEMMTAGLLTKQIAGNLNLSEVTVKLHRRHVMDKMHAESLAALVRMADRVKKS